MSLKFYYSPMSSATSVHWALEELGVPYEKVKIDLTAGDQRKPEYLALNPNGKVPLIVDEGVPVFESVAIMIYLGERYGVEKGLFPEPTMKRAEALKWMAWASVSLFSTAFYLIRNTMDRFPAEQRNALAAESAKKEIGELLAIADKALEGKEYFLGDKFTLADIPLAGYMFILGRLGVDTAPYKNLQAWAGRCMARPALARAMQG